MIATTELKKGTTVEMEGKPYLIIQSNFVNPGKGSAFVRVRMKNLITNLTLEKTFKSGVDTGLIEPNLEERKVEYLYKAGSEFFFMDQDNFETISIEEEYVGDSSNYLKEGTKLSVLYYNGRPITIKLPIFIELLVTSAEEGVRGDTVSGQGSKKATLETGLELSVPIFVKEGNVLRIDTRTGEYIERVKS